MVRVAQRGSGGGHRAATRLTLPSAGCCGWGADLSAVQELHDAEFNGGIAWPEQGKILVYLGCPLDPPPRQRMFGEALVGNFAEAEAWLRKRRSEAFGEAVENSRSPEPASSAIDRLFAAGVPGSVYWVYDSAFGVTLGDRKSGVTNWAEAEAWLESQRDEHCTVSAQRIGFSL
jgi:hypothetical protein